MEDLNAAIPLTHEQKIAVALNDLPAADLPELIYTDGPNGIRGADGATAFPSGLAVAASFDVDLAERFGIALGRESLAAGRNGILAPGLDIARVAWAGRIAEALGEDPVLVGDVGAAIVRGIQSQGVLAVPKHFVANNFEYLRTGLGPLGRRTAAIDVKVTPRALREVYAEPFRRALMAGGAGAVLSSYNRIGGDYVSESTDILNILREWGWDGFITPDFLHAVRDDARALAAGLDFPALGGTAGRTDAMVRGLSEQGLDDIVRHTRWAVAQADVKVAPPTTEPVDDHRSQDLAQEILERGSVLLANRGILPLDRDTIGSIALVGIDNVDHLIVMGGSAAVTLSPTRIALLADALAECGPVEVTTIAGSRGDVPLPTWSGQVDVTITDETTGAITHRTLDQFALHEPLVPATEDWSAVLSAVFVPELTGEHLISLTFGGEASLYLNDELLASGYREASPMIHGPEYPVQATVMLQAGTPATLRVEYQSGPAFRIPPIVTPGVKVGLAEPDDRIAAAAKAATAADVAVVVVGRVSGEAMDVESLSLPGDQERLVREIARANPNTVVVTCGAGPIVMPWADDVAAVLHVWNPGERFAPALARLMFGDAEPGGRLPLTFPISEQTTPVSTLAQYPGIDGVADYSEDLLVGYRWFHAHQHRPAFAFGHGLGYTAFSIEGIESLTVAESQIDVRVRIRNDGARVGRTVVQLYQTPPAAAESPARTLVGFAPIELGAGAGAKVSVTIPLRDLAIWDAEHAAYRVIEGQYLFEAGLSSTDIGASASATLGSRVYPTSSTMKAESS
ncbi:glycoside hydrolase family 3 C-terminal domain-containing protein [Microbacterium sp. 2FI]|uniref:glycoside hydrolase family 3 protein n=1 Tax=Microbacterium sp. 2FI TaxID=2502193 RepID=UPI0010F69AA8|nr:glycoside hydrolase family 3 C-terminal domain-containing protein [Microbacterium sp. 2FI]